MADEETTQSPKPADTPTARRRLHPVVSFGGLLVLVAAATVIITFTLIRMVEHKQDARTPYLQVVDLDETSTDPSLWGQNWPHHYEQYLRTAGDKFYGGSSAMPESKLDHQPWLKRLYAGYAFALDYREARGHAYMLYDQVVTQRVNLRQQSGACLHCHGSVSTLYRKVGLEAMGKEADDEALAREFNMEAVQRGFAELSREPYHDVLLQLTQMPDGTPVAEGDTPFESPPVGGFDAQTAPERHFAMSEAHPVSCIDCHDPETMSVRITRPGFMNGIADLAASDAPVASMPSIERWRNGDRAVPYNPNEMATRQEMRSFVCGQCHVEYYCASKDVLTFPWAGGLTVEDAEEAWDTHVFPDGSEFADYMHKETGAKLYKAQHPEFELWNQGIHARSGVSCADCHMPYERVGAMKLSNHTVLSPLNTINTSCQPCHNVPESELRDRVLGIQDKTVKLTNRAGQAMVAMVDAIMEAKAAGVSEEALADVYVLQRKAMWRLDYISSENSRGFHADQEAARILAESIDFSRQAQAAALRLRAPQAPPVDAPDDPVDGVTPTDEG
jgi:nitrite reductase (cytochrome c-552)